MVNCERCKTENVRTNPCVKCITEMNNCWLRYSGVKFTLENPTLKHWWAQHVFVCSNPDNCFKELTRRYG